MEQQRVGDMYLRQQDIFDRTKADTPITVIGAGSLGSWLVLGLAKLGFKDITVYDDDVVEIQNIPNQFFKPTDCQDDSGIEGSAMLKVNALRNHVDLFANVFIEPKAERFERQAIKGPGLVIVTPDNMATRKSVLLRCVDNDNVIGFLDGRMGGQTYKCYHADPNKAQDVQLYLSNWHSDEAGSHEECTAKGVGYNAVMCAMELVNMAKRIVMGQEVPKQIIADSGGMWREVTW